MDFEQVIRDRFAARKFSDKEIEAEKLDAILEAWRIAPTAKNLQPIKIYVIRSAEWLAKLDKASPCRYGANTVLLVCGDKETAFMKKDATRTLDVHSTYEMDACIVATHMLLEATNQWLGNIWVELFDEKIMREEFDIPENLVPVCLLPMGYKAEDCPMNPNHSIRKSMDEIVKYK